MATTGIMGVIKGVIVGLYWGYVRIAEFRV